MSDSDDDVSWGPLTLTDVKWFLQEPNPPQIKHRMSDTSFYNRLNPSAVLSKLENTFPVSNYPEDSSGYKKFENSLPVNSTADEDKNLVVIEEEELKPAAKTVFSRLYEEIKTLFREYKHENLTQSQSCIYLPQKSNLKMKKEREMRRSVSESILFGFNDTVEEMEMAVRYGLDYVMPGDKEFSQKKKVQFDKNIRIDDGSELKIGKKKAEIVQPKALKSKDKYWYVVSPISCYIKGGGSAKKKDKENNPSALNRMKKLFK